MKRALPLWPLWILSAIALAGLAFVATEVLDRARIAWRYDRYQVLQLKDGNYGFYGRFNRLETFDRCEDAQHAASSSIAYWRIKDAEYRESLKRNWNPLKWLDLRYVPAEPVECGPKEAP